VDRLPDILDDPERNGAYRLAAPVPHRPGLVRLDARTAPTRDALLRELGARLGFPDYYGVNWDAFEECLLDLSWRPGPVLLLLEHADALEADALATLLEIWGQAAAFWDEAGRSCVLLLDGAGPEGLPQVGA
jgi:RNAse (barnase) inhibitor barstar